MKMMGSRASLLAWMWISKELTQSRPDVLVYSRKHGRTDAMVQEVQGRHL